MKIHALCLGSHPTTHTSTLDSSFVSCFSLNLAMLTIIYISRRNPFSPWHLSNRVTGSSSPFLHEMCSQTSTVVCFCNTLHLDSLTHSSVHQPSSGMRTLAALASACTEPTIPLGFFLSIVLELFYKTRSASWWHFFSEIKSVAFKEEVFFRVSLRNEKENYQASQNFALQKLRQWVDIKIVNWKQLFNRILDNLCFSLYHPKCLPKKLQKCDDKKIFRSL